MATSQCISLSAAAGCTASCPGLKTILKQMNAASPTDPAVNPAVAPVPAQFVTPSTYY